MHYRDKSTLLFKPKSAGSTRPLIATYEMRRFGSTSGFCSYIGYTATPQANALISIADGLSPDFCVMLKPGSGYTGGQFSLAKRLTGLVGDRYVRVIPNDDLA